MLDSVRNRTDGLELPLVVTVSSSAVTTGSKREIVGGVGGVPWTLGRSGVGVMVGREIRLGLFSIKGG
jgi:hypothetical protein